MKKDELRQQTAQELVALSHEISKEIYDLNNQLRFHRKLEKPHVLRTKKRDRARILTLIREKEKE